MHTHTYTFNTQTHIRGLSLTHTHGVSLSLSLSHAHARASARAPACVCLTPPSTPGSTLPASSSQPPRLSRALRPTRFLARIQHAVTEATQSARPHTRAPGPARSQPLTSSAPLVTSSWLGAARMLCRAVAPAAQAPPTPRHSHRIATARAARGPGSELGPQAAWLPGARARRGPRRSAIRVPLPGSLQQAAPHLGWPPPGSAPLGLHVRMLLLLLAARKGPTHDRAPSGTMDS